MAFVAATVNTSRSHPCRGLYWGANAGGLIEFPNFSVEGDTPPPTVGYFCYKHTVFSIDVINVEMKIKRKTLKK